MLRLGSGISRRGQVDRPALDINFMVGGLDPRVTFTRANTAGYTDRNGVAQTAAVNEPRFTADGLLIQDAAGAGAAESAVMGDVSWYNAASGTFVVEFLLSALSAANMTLISVNDATANERQTMRVSTAGFAVSITVDGNVSQQQTNAGSFTTGVVQRVAFAYEANNFAMARNGVIGTTDAAGTLPAITRLQLGSYLTTEHLNGCLRRVRYWPTRKSAAQMLSLTAV
jgi:hypothetical protein